MTEHGSNQREVMTLAEAADFLRFSISTMHQRRDIPRHPVPGSKQYRYLRSELLNWLMGKHSTVGANESESAKGQDSFEQTLQPIVDISFQPLYHRNTRYR